MSNRSLNYSLKFKVVPGLCHLLSNRSLNYLYQLSNRSLDIVNFFETNKFYSTEVLFVSRINNNFDHTLKYKLAKSIFFKPYGEDGIEVEYMMQHHHDNIFGHTKLFFTIVEEPKEDLESEDGKCGNDSRGRSLGDC